ncbi:hypothetical protein SAMN05421786_11549 [Chryseobacterium ureilyticum]|uniref:Oxidase n=1 Tax=Chryseobacterium ureilyticum TaxID=373668 RepID=A0A1N7QS85_9FLAO|nr:hypothetical protein [Chryseobacterium ureilyticum]SIT25656.1 hypothetical protein SAMN05421786_11549 [Chryseobacterium ureilyticum]
MPFDLILDENFDIKIEDGDFVIGESTFQNQNLLILADKGQFKMDPTVGVGTRRFLESSKKDDLAREIRQEFIKDGMFIKSLSISPEMEIKVDAVYNNG